MTRIIQTDFDFVNENFSGFSLGLVGGNNSTSLEVSPYVSPPAPAGGILSGGGLSPRRPALQATPEHEGGGSPHNQPVGSVVRPTAAPFSKPDTIASRVRARLRVRARVSRWLAWITYLLQGDEIR